MRSTPEQRAFARELHAKGLTPGQIAYRVGFHKQTVRCWLDPDLRRRKNAKSLENRRAKREILNRKARLYMRRQRKGTCPVCQRRVPKPGIKRCSRCRQEDREWLWREIQGYWRNGLKLREIALEVGLPMDSVGHHIRRMRDAGWDVPRRRAT